MRERRRAGVLEAVEPAKRMGDKNAGVEGIAENDHLHCPCIICGHSYQWECLESSFKDKGGCDCCSTTCT